MLIEQQRHLLKVHALSFLEMSSISDELRHRSKLTTMIKALVSSPFNLYGQLGYIDHTAMAGKCKQASIHRISNGSPILLVLLYLAYPSSFVSVYVCISSYSMSISCCIFSIILFSLSNMLRSMFDSTLNNCFLIFFF